MLFDSISLWLAGIFLSSTMSTTFATVAFFIAAVVTMSAPLFIGLFMTKQGNPRSVFLLLTFPMLVLGLAIGVTPVVHDQQFHICEVRPVEYKGVTIQEYWCATRDNLNDEFGEKTFKTVLQQRY